MPAMYKVCVWKLKTYFMIKLHKIASLQEAYALNVGGDKKINLSVKSCDHKKSGENKAECRGWEILEGGSWLEKTNLRR